MINITYTFVNTPTGAPNEIVIGPDAATTAANIAAVINATYGAIFTATYSSGEKLLVLNFEGEDGATTWVEEAQGLEPFRYNSFTLDTSQSKFGTASLRGSTSEITTLQYKALDTTSIKNFTFSGYLRVASNGQAVVCMGGEAEGVLTWLYLVLANNPLTLNISIDGINDEDITDEIIDYTFNNDTWYHIAVIVNGPIIQLSIDGTIVKEWVSISPNPFDGVVRGGQGVYVVFGTGSSVPNGYSWYDAWELVNYAKWTSNFTPPTVAPFATNDGVVYITDYTSDTITKTASGSGLSISASVQSITYTSSLASSTIPSFAGYAEGMNITEDLGDIYGLSIIAPFTGSASSVQSGIVGNSLLPSFTGNANSFIVGKTINSSDADIISLLLCSSTWMDNFAAMIAVPGDNDDTALVITQWVHHNITYATDLSVWGVADYWIDPRATLYYGVGDCEDGAFLTASLMMHSGIPASRVRVYIGTYNGVGHAWVAYMRESDDKWVFLDWLSGTIDWTTTDSVATLPLAYPTDVATYTSASDYVSCSVHVDLNSFAEYITSLTGLNTEVGKGILFSEFSIGGQTGLNADGNILFPEFAVESTTGQSVSIDFPVFNITSTAFISPSINGDIIFSLFDISSIGLTGEICSGDVKVPSFTITATTQTVPIGNGVITFPSFVVDSYASTPVSHYGVRLNTTNFAVSQYDNFDFNSMCKFNGHILCTGVSGIVAYEGNDDKGVDIDSYFQLPSYDYQSHKQKSFRKVFLEGDSEGDLRVTAIVNDVAGGYYEIGSLGIAEETQYSFPLNREDRGSLLGLKIANKNGVDFTISSVFATLIVGNTLASGYTILGRSKITFPEFTVSASG